MSAHVHVISDRNVGSGSERRHHRRLRSATLVVDTGLGPRNGQTVLHATRALSATPDLFVVATHFHPEHALGESAFPATARIIRARAQQQDIDEFGLDLAKTFASRSALVADLLKDAQFRKADILFDREYTLDLGGVRVRLLSLGPTHTRGDTIVWVEGDRVLFAGDVVMNRAFVAFASPYSSVRAWLKDFDELSALMRRCVVPSHGHWRRRADRRAADDDAGDSGAGRRAEAGGEIGRRPPRKRCSRSFRRRIRTGPRRPESR